MYICWRYCIQIWDRQNEGPQHVNVPTISDSWVYGQRLKKRICTVLLRSAHAVQLWLIVKEDYEEQTLWYFCSGYQESEVMADIQAGEKTKVFQHSTCLSDLVTSDYKIFLKINEELRGPFLQWCCCHCCKPVLEHPVAVNVGKYVGKINIKGLQQISKHLYTLLTKKCSSHMRTVWTLCAYRCSTVTCWEHFVSVCTSMQSCTLITPLSLKSKNKTEKVTLITGCKELWSMMT